MHSTHHFLTDLTLTPFEFANYVTAELRAELSEIAHYTRTNGDIHWYTITSDLSRRVHQAYMTAKRSFEFRALIA